MWEFEFSQVVSMKGDFVIIQHFILIYYIQSLLTSSLIFFSYFSFGPLPLKNSNQKSAVQNAQASAGAGSCPHYQVWVR